MPQPVLEDPALRDGPADEEAQGPYEPESPLDDTVDDAIAAEDEASAVVGGIFDDDVLSKGEPAVLRAFCYDDGDSVVPANLSGGRVRCLLCCRPLQCFLLLGQVAVMELHQGGTSPTSKPSSMIGTSSTLKASSMFGRVQLWSQRQR